MTPMPKAAGLYPCMYVALLALTRERVSHTLMATRLDGIVSGFAVASLLASVTMSTAIDSTAGAPLAEQLTTSPIRPPISSFSVPSSARLRSLAGRSIASG
jgi:hypothetical protein